MKRPIEPVPGKGRILGAVSVATSAVFTAADWFLRPLWIDVSHFLGTDLPVMLLATLVGIVVLAVALTVSERRSWGKPWHWVVFPFVNLLFAGLLGYLLFELGSERAVLFREALQALPVLLWFGVAAAYLWFVPRWKFLRGWASRLGLASLLALSAAMGLSWPWQIETTSPPAVFLHDKGVVVAWGTNLAAAGSLEYKLDGGPTRQVSSQTGGLKDLEDRIVRVSLPLPAETKSLTFTARSQGGKEFLSTNALLAGTTVSPEVSLRFLPPGAPVTFVAFSDLHEQGALYRELAKHLPWNQVAFAAYNGDLLSSTERPSQVAESILNLPTGGRDLPRVLVRGNHETRGAAARALDGWLLPSGGRWYQAFTQGNAFFLILDTGEDKPDDHEAYDGLLDFETYQREQADWLKAELKSSEFLSAQYRVVIAHIPLFGPDRTTAAFEPVASLLRGNTDIDLMLNGHTHVAGIFPPETSGLPYPVVFTGGPETTDAAAAVVQLGTESLGVQLMGTDGTVIAKLSSQPKRKPGNGSR